MQTKPFTSTVLQEHLEEHILPYWMNRMPDDVNGGFYGRIDGHDKTHEAADKGVILNTRLLWTFSAAYRMLEKHDYLTCADRAYDYVMKHFADPEYGGVYWMVDHQGTPVITKKQVYAQSFAIYGLSEYYRATNSQKALDSAIELFHLIESKAWDDEYEGYIEALNRDWTHLDDMRLSEKDLNAPKSMNTHLHILEAYTNLYRVWRTKPLADALERLIVLMCEKFVKSDGHFHLFFNMEWGSLTADYSYGHDIEGSWLIWEALEELGNEDLQNKYRALVLRMVRASLEGLDKDGGLMNEGEHGKLTDTDKHWWPQAEAMVGLINAWQMTGEDFYFKTSELIWDFIQSSLVDYRHGEWFWRVDRNGTVNYTEDKAGPWKCPYHNSRALLELLDRK